ncbi:MAG TPA: M23 family metallopeptidase, partial [Longimicrobiales bacterium]|nr:M23 family metallopeptidase [Longimicrobiales bacterium]
WHQDPRAGEMTFAAAADLDGLIRRARVLMESWREATDSLASNQDRLRSTPSISPTLGYVSSGFSSSRLHPLLDMERAHQGVDISAPRGTPIIATANGRVISAGRRGNYGIMIEIDHGYGYVSRYAHAAMAYVRPGQWVTRGDTIGEVGSTGLAAGTHVHYEVLVNGRPVNPLDYMLVGEALTY